MSDGSAVTEVLRLVFSLALVLGLMVVAARLLRARQLGGGLRSRPQAPVQVLARHGLTRGSSVAVVQVAEHVLVLGVTETSVQVLRELSPDEMTYAVPVPPAPAVTAAADPATTARPSSPAPRHQWSAPGLDLGGLLESLRERTARRG